MDKYNTARNVTHDASNDTGHRYRKQSKDSMTDEINNQYYRKKNNQKVSKLDGR
jgi:hypothetical protein